MSKESFERTMPRTKAPRHEPAELVPNDNHVRGLIASQLSAIYLDWRRPVADDARINKKTFTARLGRIEECFGWSGNNNLPPTFCYQDQSGRAVMVVSWDQARAVQPEDRASLLASLQQMETERLIAAVVFGLRTTKTVPDNWLSREMILLGNAFYRFLNGYDIMGGAVEFLMRKLKGEIANARIPIQSASRATNNSTSQSAPREETLAPVTQSAQRDETEYSERDERDETEGGSNNGDNHFAEFYGEESDTQSERLSPQKKGRSSSTGVRSSHSEETRNVEDQTGRGNKTYTVLDLARPPEGTVLTHAYCQQLLKAALHAERHQQDIDSKAQRERFVVEEITSFLHNYFRARE